jgi:hypothetical protein
MKLTRERQQRLDKSFNRALVIAVIATLLNWAGYQGRFSPRAEWQPFSSALAAGAVVLVVLWPCIYCIYWWNERPSNGS